MLLYKCARVCIFARACVNINERGLQAFQYTSNTDVYSRLPTHENRLCRSPGKLLARRSFNIYTIATTAHAQPNKAQFTTHRTRVTSQVTWHTKATICRQPPRHMQKNTRALNLFIDVYLLQPIRNLRTLQVHNRAPIYGKTYDYTRHVHFIWYASNTREKASLLILTTISHENVSAPGDKLAAPSSDMAVAAIISLSVFSSIVCYLLKYVHTLNSQWTDI